MDNVNKIAAVLKQHLTDVYNQLKIEEQDIDQNRLETIDKIAWSCSSIFAAAGVDETQIAMLAKSSAVHLLDISKKGVLTHTELDDFIYLINQKAKELCEKKDNEGQTAEDPVGPADKEDSVPFVKRELVPVGFEENSPKVSVEDFFSFPLSAKSNPSENELFAQHLRYLEDSVEQSSMQRADVEQIKPLLDTLPKYHYKKYFDGYPGGVFEEATLSMLYIKLKNKSLERLRS